MEKEKSRKINLLTIVLLMLLTFASSCIEIHVSLFVNGDGSGKGKMTYVIAKGIYQAPDEERLAINEDKLAEQLSKREGVKVIRTGSSYKDENMIKVWGEFEFKDVSKLSDGYLKYIFTKLPDNKRELRINYRITGELHRRELFKSMFKGLVSTAEIEVDGKIISTNGKKISDRKVRWEIPAEEVVGKEIAEDMIVIFEPKGKGLIQRIRERLKL